MKERIHGIRSVMLTLFWFVLMASWVCAELRQETTYPVVGKVGQDLELSLAGTGFDAETRISVSLDVLNKRSIIASVNAEGVAEAVEIIEDRAFLAIRKEDEGTGGYIGALKVISISDPSNPVIIGSVDTSGGATDIAVNGDYAYLTDWDSGLQIIDISNAASPNIVRTADTPGYARGVAVSGNYAYVADWTEGLQIIDISNPPAAEIIGIADVSDGATDVAVSGNYAYMANQNEGLQIMDISNSSKPEFVTSLYVPGTAVKIMVDRDYAYIAAWESGLQIIDVSNPLEPEIAGSTDTPSYAWGLMVRGNQVYVADIYKGLQVIDVSNRKNPKIIGFADTSGHAMDVVVRGEYAYVADGENGGLKVADVSDDLATNVGTADMPKVAGSVVMTEKYAYVTDSGESGGLWIIDVTDPMEPTRKAKLDIQNGATDIAMDDRHAYLTNTGESGAIKIVSVRYPSAPEAVASVNTPGDAYGVTICDGHLYVADGEAGGLQVIDVTDPLNPGIVGYLDTRGRANDVAVMGNYAYVADGEDGGLQVVDVSIPSDPKLAGFGVDTPGKAYSVVTEEDYAYVADGSAGGIQIIDVRIPSSPKIVGSVDTPGDALNLLLVGNHLYVADGVDGGVQVVDVSDKQNPMIIGAVDTPGYALGLDIKGSHAYVADAYAGLTIVPLPIEITSVFENEESMRLTIPGHELTGSYTLNIFNGEDHRELLGAVNIVEKDELKLGRVNGTLGVVEENLNGVILEGQGFDQNTRVSISLDVVNESALIGFVDTPGNAEAVAVSEGYAYVADWDKGLQVINICNPLAPQSVGTLDTPGYATDVKVIEGYAYLADGENGLQVIDISDLKAMQIVDTIDTLGYAWGVAINGSHLYVADGDQGLQIMDISDPSHPDKKSSVPTPGSDARKVEVKNNYAYIADGENGGLQIMDVSNPASPKIVGNVDTPGNARSLAVNGTIAYVADGEGGLQIINIEEPQSPQMIASIDIPRFASDVEVIGNRAYVTDLYRGLQVIDIGEPENPKIVASVNTPGFALGITGNGRYSYIADGTKGLRIIDANERQKTVSFVNTTGRKPWGVEVVGNYAYVTDNTMTDQEVIGRLEVIDISDPQSPQIVGSVEIGGSATGLVIEGDYAYVGAWDKGLQVINIGNPEHPFIIDDPIDIPAGYIIDVATDGNYIYAADCNHNGSLQVINTAISEIVGSVNTRGEAYDIAVREGYAYVADGIRGLQVIDISNPTNPALKGSVLTPGIARGVTAGISHVYVADETDGLQIIDVTDPETPLIIAYLETPGIATDITTNDNYVYMTDESEGVLVIDVGNPENPVIIGTMNVLSYAFGLDVSGEYAYVADAYVGLTILPLPLEIGEVTFENESKITLNIPSPPSEGDYTLRVFNGKEHYELPGAVTFVSPESSELLETKAIIVAGRSSPKDYLWKDVRQCTISAYNALIRQGYTSESIYFLSPEDIDADEDDESDVDTDATSANLADAISRWATDENPAYGGLIVYMVGHGGDGVFDINGDPNDTISAEKLDEWLDDFQQQENMSGNLIVVYDACHSGSFLPLMTPPEDKERIVITSTQPDEAAEFLEYGEVPGDSFSYQFWTAIRDGYGLYNAFLFAQEMIKDSSTPLIDDDGNGERTERDGAKATGITIGRGYKSEPDKPFIRIVCGDQTLDGEPEARLWASHIFANGISSVRAKIISPCYHSGASLLSTNNPPIEELKDADGDGKYEYIYDKFTIEGTYKVNIYVIDEEGNSSYPEQVEIVQKSGTSCLEPGDVNGDGKIEIADVIIMLKLLAGNADGEQIYGYPEFDVNEDGRIGMEEAVYILRYIADLL
ncbi:MAG: hypothetical protein DRI57_01285 [Deltaproteobacteria bacterium]|nr:MAG: hypothetical protein DRI57_01285 [Deltaproteobacteria bacterium]